MAQLTEESLIFFARNQSDIYIPIRKSQRVKYTCFHVCSSYIAFGSSSGGVYLFRNHPNGSQEYLFTILIADNCGPISCVAFAPHDNHLIAMATSRGHLIVAEIEPQNTSTWLIAYQSNNFTKHWINILKWDHYYDYRLYIGDRSGQIFILHNVKDLKTLMVVPQPSIILKLMAEIYQLEVCMDLLLLSTLSKYVLYDVSTGELTQIGKKSVRSDGQSSYGVCFFPKFANIRENDNHIYNCIFCSRPKSRLWECNLKGTVRFTHQFKELLINQMPQKIINGQNISCAIDKFNTNGNIVTKAQPTPTFAKLCVMNVECLDQNLIVTFANSPNTCVYVINPINACIVSYCVLDVNQIQDIYCIDCDIYLIYNTNQEKRLQLCRISFLTREQCLKSFIENNEFKSGANFVINQMEYFTENYTKNSKNQTKLQFSPNDKLLEQLWSNLKSEDKQQFQSIEQLIIRSMSRENSFLIDKSQEFFENSILETNGTDGYNNSQSVERLYFDISSQYNDSTIIDAVDVEFTEPNKFKNLVKDIVFSKLNSNQIKTNSEELLLSSDMDTYGLEEQLFDNTVNCLEENNQINLIENNTEDNARHELELILEQMEIQLKSTQLLTQYKCDCNSPLPGSHLKLTETQNQINRLLNENLDFMEYSVIDLIAISERNGIWSLYMQLLLKCQEYHKYLKSSLMLNDVKLLLQTEFIENYLFSSENFEQLLRLFAKQRDIGSNQIQRCIECNKSLNNIENSIKWETIIRFCINRIGVEEALNLLNKFLDRKPIFSTEFYLFLLRIRMIYVYQSPITREKLNKLINHLNSVSKYKTSSSVQSMASNSSSVITKTISGNQNQRKGFKINISEEICSKCGTKLRSKLEKSGQKLLIFYCKHYYHKSCLNSDENHCILCEK